MCGLFNNPPRCQQRAPFYHRLGLPLTFPGARTKEALNFPHPIFSSNFEVAEATYRHTVIPTRGALPTFKQLTRGYFISADFSLIPPADFPRDFYSRVQLGIEEQPWNIDKLDKTVTESFAGTEMASTILRPAVIKLNIGIIGSTRDW